MMSSQLSSMETRRLLLLTLSPPFSTTTPLKTSTTTRNLNLSPNSVHCCYTNKRSSSPSNNTSTSASSSWDSTFRSKFKFTDGDDGDVEDYDEEEDGSRFRWRDSGRKKRKWWSDADADADDEWGQGNGGGGGVVEEVIEYVWFFKVLRSFGWLLPAIIVSMLVSSGPKAFLMAIALPLGQSALSFAFDKVFRRTRERPKRRPRTKRRPFAGATSSVEINEEELDESSGINEGKQGYQSWVATDSGTVKQKVDQGKPSFGGWDELDRRQQSNKQTTRRQREKTGGPPRQGAEKGKMSRRGRRKEAPLLLRLLIAVFPFLGSWTKLF